MPKTIYKTIIDFTIPYTYYLEWTTGMKYYGVRYSNGSYVGDIMQTYFTSSSHVTKYIKENGKPNIVIVDKCFETKVEALEYEHQFLMYNNAAKSETWLNKSNGYGKFHCVSHTPETKKKLSIASAGHLGTKNCRYGKHLSDEAKAKISLANLGKKHTPETKRKISILLSGENCSEETRKKMSISKTGEKNHFYGKTHTDESREKMSAAILAISKVECIHCGILANVGNIRRCHNDNCKHKK